MPLARERAQVGQVGQVAQEAHSVQAAQAVQEHATLVLVWVSVWSATPASRAAAASALRKLHR